MALPCRGRLSADCPPVAPRASLLPRWNWDALGRLGEPGGARADVSIERRACSTDYVLYCIHELYVGKRGRCRDA